MKYQNRNYIKLFDKWTLYNTKSSIIQKKKKKITLYYQIVNIYINIFQNRILFKVNLVSNFNVDTVVTQCCITCNTLH